MIDGVKTKPLRAIPDERGKVMEIFRSDDGLFSKFGQVYMTTTYPDVIKAWHLHEEQTDNISCIQGMIKMALYDARPHSSTFKEINQLYLGVYNPLLVQIPANIYHGWMCVSQEEAIIINVPTEVYNYEKPDEKRLDPYQNEIPYEWKRKDG
ncbi:dTDP-4-dehydrorhamnose 3,5-epimerase family protein [Acidobacteriota bacterium]